MGIDLLALLQRRRQAIDALSTALGGINDDVVRETAERARREGIYAPDEIDWPNVEQREARAAGVARLRAAFETGDDAVIGPAYAWVTALWPAYLDPESEKKGLAAFRRWGRALRQQQPHNR